MNTKIDSVKEKLVTLGMEAKEADKVISKYLIYMEKEKVRKILKELETKEVIEK